MIFESWKDSAFIYHRLQSNYRNILFHWKEVQKSFNSNQLRRIIKKNLNIFKERETTLVIDIEYLQAKWQLRKTKEVPKNENDMATAPLVFTMVTALVVTWSSSGAENRKIVDLIPIQTCINLHFKNKN